MLSPAFTLSLLSLSCSLQGNCDETGLSFTMDTLDIFQHRAQIFNDLQWSFTWNHSVHSHRSLYISACIPHQPPANTIEMQSIGTALSKMHINSQQIIQRLPTKVFLYLRAACPETILPWYQTIPDNLRVKLNVRDLIKGSSNCVTYNLTYTYKELPFVSYKFHNKMFLKINHTHI